MARRKKKKSAYDKVDEYLTKVYTNTKGGGSFGGVSVLLNQIKLENKFHIPRKRVIEFLQSRDEYTLHRPATKKYDTEKVIVGGINDYHQADIIVLNSFIKQNDGYGYILCGIDCFTRYAWTVPMKTKAPSDVVPALELIYKGRDTPTTLVTDAGKEFT